MKKNGIFLVVMLILFGLAGCRADTDWRTASRESSGILPDPETSHEAVLSVLGANAWSWRGWFAIHTWIAAKKTGESVYTVYDVVGWRGRHGRPVLDIREDIPDRYWYGSRPELIQLKKGEGVDELIDKVDKAARAYPWKTTYKAFPGPNSNTFTAWVGLLVPELEMELPFSAIGSGYTKIFFACPGDGFSLNIEASGPFIMITFQVPVTAKRIFHEKQRLFEIVQGGWDPSHLF